MKRLGTILMACALVLGLSQCKKENTNANVNEDGEKVYIVLKVEDGQRSDVTPSAGVYTYEEGDKLIVGYNGAYCGVLSYNSSNEFSGYITISEDVSQPLYFYYIGEAATVVKSGDSYTINISNQSEGLPVLACAHSSVNYSSGKSNYHAHLRNKCSLVEFRLAEGTSDPVTVGGMHTVASIDFANGTIVATSTTDNITLYSESSTSKWAILLPKNTSTSTSATIGGTSYDVTVPAISANGYFHGTTGSTPAVAIDNTPAGPVDYVFTVDAQGTKVHFSPGNLQYQATSDTWRFAENQWDFVGDGTLGNVYEEEVKCDNALISPDYDGWIDLFGWSGEEVENFGINNSEDYGDYGGDFLDWGEKEIYNPLTDDYDPSNTWRTLEQDEWEYLLEERITLNGNADDLRGAATVNGVPGLIILPDNFDGDVSWDNTMSGWDDNVVSSSVWEADWESHGAVFLPAAGYRLGTGVYVVGDDGRYWSASPNGAFDAWNLDFDEYDVYTDDIYYRDYGYSVRLVR